MRMWAYVVLLVLGSIALTAAPIPAGWTCVGNCGSLGPDGVVTASPKGGDYLFVSTTGGVSGAGRLPNPLGGETNGSFLTSPAFSANPGDQLDFYFNYITSDGTMNFIEYGWAGLVDTSDNSVSVLFTARTNPNGNAVPGFGMGVPLQGTLTPSSTPIIAGGPAWSALGGYSGACYGGVGAGCGYTGWIQSLYTIPTAGNYQLAIGVVNWGDTLYDTGLALDGAFIAGKPITEEVPEPSTFAMLGLGAGLILMRARRK